MREFLLLLFLILIIIEIHLNISFEYALLGLLLVCFSYMLLRRQSVKLHSLRVNKANKVIVLYLSFLLFEAICTIPSMLFETNIFAIDSMKVFLASQLTTAFVALYLAEGIRWDRFFLYIQWVAIVFGVFGIIEYATKTYFVSRVFGFIKPFCLPYEHTSMFRLSSFFSSPAIAALFFLLAIISLHYYGFNNLFLQILAGMIYVINIYGTRTRIIWLATAIFYCIVVARFVIGYRSSSAQSQRKKYTNYSYLLVSIILLFAMVGIVAFMWDKVIEIFDDVKNYLSLVLDMNNTFASREIRAGNISNVVCFLYNNPIRLFAGEGLGAGVEFSHYNAVYTTEGGTWNLGIDNQFLTTWLETGIIGIVLYIGIFAYGINRSIRNNNANVKMGCILLIIIFIMSVSMDVLWWKMCNFVLVVGIKMLNEQNKEKGLL